MPNTGALIGDANANASDATFTGASEAPNADMGRDADMDMPFGYDVFGDSDGGVGRAECWHVLILGCASSPGYYPPITYLHTLFFFESKLLS